MIGRSIATAHPARHAHLLPKGTPDPSATLHNSTMFVMAGLLVVALVANLLVRPVDPRHHIEERG